MKERVRLMVIAVLMILAVWAFGYNTSPQRQDQPSSQSSNLPTNDEPVNLQLDSDIHQMDVVYVRGGMMMHCPENTYTVTCLEKDCTAAGHEIQRDCHSQRIEVTRTVSAHPIPYELVAALGDTLVSLQPIKDPVVDPPGVICQGRTDDFPYFAITATTSQSQTVFVGSKCNTATNLWKVRFGNQWYNQTTGEIPAAYFLLLRAAQGQ